MTHASYYFRALAALGLVAATAACSGPNAEAKTGALTGAGIGAAAGAIIAHDDLEGAAIGAVGGAALGGLLGHIEDDDRGGI